MEMNTIMMNYLDRAQIIRAKSQLILITIVKSRKLKGVKINIQKLNTLIN